MMKKPKILSALMVLGLSASLLGQVPVMAEEADQTQTTDAAGGITTNSISGWPQASDISSEAAVVMENSTNTVLYSKNADEVLFPGSTVKIMTCLLALENAQLTDQVTMTATGVSGVTDGGASISSQVDEVFTVEQCLYAIMVASANDIALQIAEHAGSYTHLRAHETGRKLVCRLLLEKKKTQLDPGARDLLFSLHEIAAVGADSALVLRNDAVGGIAM